MASQFVTPQVSGPGPIQLRLPLPQPDQSLERGFGQLASGLERVSEQWAETDAQESLNKFQAEVGQLDASYFSTEGKAARDGYDGYAQQVQALAEKHAAELSGITGALFTKHASPMVVTKINHAAQHAAQGHKHWQVDVANGAAKDAAFSAAQDPMNPEVWNAALAKADGAVQSLVNSGQLSPELAAATKRERIGPMVLDRVEQLAAANPETATQFLSQSQQWLTSEQVLAGQASIKKAATLSAVRRAELAAQTGGHGAQALQWSPRTQAAAQAVGGIVPHFDPKIAKGADVNTLARYIDGEAGGEGLLGMYAVAAVMQNRALANHAGFGETLMAQATAKNQFQADRFVPNFWTRPISADAVRVAQELIEGRALNPVGDALYYARPEHSTAAWAKKLNDGNALRIGNHLFVVSPEGGKPNGGDSFKTTTPEADVRAKLDNLNVQYTAKPLPDGKTEVNILGGTVAPMPKTLAQQLAEARNSLPPAMQNDPEVLAHLDTQVRRNVEHQHQLLTDQVHATVGTILSELSEDDTVSTRTELTAKSPSAAKLLAELPTEQREIAIHRLLSLRRETRAMRAEEQAATINKYVSNAAGRLQLSKPTTPEEVALVDPPAWQKLSEGDRREVLATLADKHTRAISTHLNTQKQVGENIAQEFLAQNAEPLSGQDAYAQLPQEKRDELGPYAKAAFITKVNAEAGRRRGDQSANAYHRLLGLSYTNPKAFLDTVFEQEPLLEQDELNKLYRRQTSMKSALERAEKADAREALKSGIDLLSRGTVNYALHDMAKQLMDAGITPKRSDPQFLELVGAVMAAVEVEESFRKTSGGPPKPLSTAEVSEIIGGAIKTTANSHWWSKSLNFQEATETTETEGLLREQKGTPFSELERRRQLGLNLLRSLGKRQDNTFNKLRF